eukprot:jgi/Picsp_1/3244/NSC_06084-R1_serine threonine-protein kinase 19
MGDGFPSDALVAIRLLRRQEQNCPFVLKTQVYSLLRNKTDADMDIDKLRRENKIRVFNFQSDVPRDIGLMETREYNCLIDRCRAEAKDTSMARYAHVFDWLKDDVLIQCTSPIISRDSLGRFLSRPLGRTSKRELQEGHFDTLLHFSVIRRGGMGSTRSSIEEFCFALPYCGEFVRSIDTGRCELINIIRRSRHGEMLGSKLDNVKLRKSSMSVQWHVKDLLGSGDLERLETTVGTLFRLV